MALTSAQQWRVRTDGDNTNGGGYDPTVSGAGTDYTDQAAAQLSLTDLATSGAASTTLTSVTGGFTSAMIGNIIRISAGTNFTAGYYAVTARTDTNTVTLDRSPTPSGAGSGGSGKLGGAFATFEPLGGTGNNGLSTPSITTPLAAGHTIYVRGSGNSNPSSIDYDYKGSSSNGYWGNSVNGSLAEGLITVIGYNGRPYIEHSGLIFWPLTYWCWDNIKFKLTSSAAWYEYGLANSATQTNGILFKNCIYDTNGQNCRAFCCSFAYNCVITNSGGGSGGTLAAIHINDGGAKIHGCFIIAVTGYAINVDIYSTAISNTVIANCGADAIVLPALGFGISLINNTIYNCVDGIEIMDAYGAYKSLIVNNTISNCSKGIHFSAGSTALNDRLVRGKLDYNNLYNNTTNYTNVSAGSNDKSVDPQFTNTGSIDYSIGTNLKAQGTPASYPTTATNNYIDIGAAQRQEAGAGGLLIHSGMGGGIRG